MLCSGVCLNITKCVNLDNTIVSKTTGGPAILISYWLLFYKGFNYSCYGLPIWGFLMHYLLGTYFCLVVQYILLRSQFTAINAVGRSSHQGRGSSCLQNLFVRLHGKLLTRRSISWRLKHFQEGYISRTTWNVTERVLTLWGRVTHMCVSKLTAVSRGMIYVTTGSISLGESLFTDSRAAMLIVSLYLTKTKCISTLLLYNSKN